MIIMIFIIKQRYQLIFGVDIDSIPNFLFNHKKC